MARPVTQGRILEVLNEIEASYTKARVNHAPMHSPHEGYAVIKEEFDELWDEIKAWQPKPLGYGTHEYQPDPADVLYDKNMRDMRKEALHVAAMALAFLLEVTE